MKKFSHSDKAFIQKHKDFVHFNGEGNAVFNGRNKKGDFICREEFSNLYQVKFFLGLVIG